VSYHQLHGLYGRSTQSWGLAAANRQIPTKTVCTEMHSIFYARCSRQTYHALSLDCNILFRNAIVMQYGQHFTRCKKSILKYWTAKTCDAKIYLSRSSAVPWRRADSLQTTVLIQSLPTLLATSRYITSWCTTVFASTRTIKPTLTRRSRALFCWSARPKTRSISVHDFEPAVVRHCLTRRGYYEPGHAALYVM